jgi:hypothetical protein
VSNDDIIREAGQLGRNKGEELVRSVADQITADMASDIASDRYWGYPRYRSRPVFDLVGGDLHGEYNQAGIWTGQPDVLHELGLISDEQREALLAASETITGARATIDGILNSDPTIRPAWSAFSEQGRSVFAGTVEHQAEQVLIAQRGPAYEAGHDFGAGVADGMSAEECQAMVDGAGKIRADAEIPDPFDVGSEQAQHVRSNEVQITLGNAVGCEATAFVQYEGGFRDGWSAEVERKAAG